MKCPTCDNKNCDFLLSLSKSVWYCPLCGTLYTIVSTYVPEYYNFFALLQNEVSLSEEITKSCIEAVSAFTKISKSDII